MKALRESLVMFVALTLLTGIAYPVVITLIAQIVFPYQANGSLIVLRQDSPGYERHRESFGNRYFFWSRADADQTAAAKVRLIGSELIGQSFTDARYFWSRPSAAGYNGGASAGSNYGPTNPAQLDALKQRVADSKAVHAGEGDVPVDLVTASGSGLDPHISPAAAAFQVSRVAQARGIDRAQVRELVAVHTSSRTFGLLGEPRVNVLTLNLALDSLAR
jgi:potassium-transporting ATPase KdpC subunit